MKEVYNGYEEKYYTGAELADLYPGEYIGDGRHHAAVLGITVREFILLHPEIESDHRYRVFVNDSFCKVLSDDDKQIVFFAHIPIEQVRITHDMNDVNVHLKCPTCGSLMNYKVGRYGAFLGCIQYPQCKYTEKVLIIGKL